jgi:predicted PurR-regulated permease PerM
VADEANPPPATHLPPRTIRFDLLNVALSTAVVLAVVQAFRFLDLVQGVLVLLVLAVIVATAIEPVVIQLRSLGLRRGYSVLVVFAFVLAVVVVFVVLIAQAVIEQLTALLTALPQLSRQLEDVAGRLPAGPARDGAVALTSQLTPNVLREVFASMATTGTLTGLAFATLTFVESVFAVLTILVIAYFWIAERLTIRRLFLRMVSPEHREHALEIWNNVESKLGAWARGLLLLMFIVGTMQGVGYVLIGVRFPLLLAVWAGLAEMIPLVGPYIGVVPAVLVALAQSPAQAALVVVYTIVVSLVESNVLIPRIMQHAVGLSPLTVVLALLAGAAIYGLVGAFLAVPIAAAIQAILVELAPAPKQA